MKAEKIIAAGFALRGEEYADFQERELTIHWLDSALAMCEIAQKLYDVIHHTESDSSFTVKSAQDEVNMCDTLVRVSLPYAVAESLAFFRGDNDSADIFGEKFTQSLFLIGASEEKISDVYGGGYEE